MSNPLDEQVSWQVEDSIAHITINAPDHGNALDPARRDRLTELLGRASEDLSVRAVVLTGAGDRHFCTGAALGSPQPGPQQPEGAPDKSLGEVAAMIRHGWQRLAASILDCAKPVVAAVNGTAAGGGAQLVLASDLVVMADTARLIEVFVRRGIIPDAGGAYLLPRLVGLHKAKELMFLGDEVSAQEAERIGIANQVVPAADLQATARDLAARLAGAPTKALAMTKWLLNRSFESSRETAFDEEGFAQELVMGTRDAQEGVRAFVERRSPEFKGW